jgi:hypothetical protein
VLKCENLFLSVWQFKVRLACDTTLPKIPANTLDHFKILWIVSAWGPKWSIILNQGTKNSTHPNIQTNKQLIRDMKKYAPESKNAFL